MSSVYELQVIASSKLTFHMIETVKLQRTISLLN